MTESQIRKMTNTELLEHYTAISVVVGRSEVVNEDMFLLWKEIKKRMDWKFDTYNV